MTISCATCGREHTAESYEYAQAQARAGGAVRRVRLKWLVVGGIILALSALGAAVAVWQATR